MEQFGKYILVEQIAEGGMGEVFLARQRGLAEVERLVVLKRIRPTLRDQEQFEDLFLSEARITARLNHPNVVQLYEFGRIEESYFLTFERVRGQNLAQMRKLRPEGWPAEVVFELAVQLLAGLQHVHALQDFDGRPLGIVHRDVSPPNVMVSFEGTAKLLDFGVARSAQDPNDPHGTIHGKFPYLSPEQCSFKPLDARSDLFSLGAMLYELLTGERSFSRATEAETVGAVLFHQPPPPSAIVPALPPVIDQIVMRALEKEPADRWASAETMAEAVDVAAATLGLPRGPRLLQRFVESLNESASGRRRAPRELPPTAPIERSVLLVDDDDDNLQALRRTFRGRYNLLATTDPREALRLVETNVVHLIVTDQLMPHMTGVELLEAATRKQPHVLKVITSALSDAHTLLDAINRTQVHRYLLKPWQPDDLRRTVEELLAEHAGELRSGALSRRLEEEAARLADLSGEDTREQPVGKGRRLRPELLRAVSESPRVALLLVALAQPDGETAGRLADRMQAELGPGDAAVAVSDEKVGLVLLEGTGDVRARLSAVRERIGALTSTMGLAEPAIAQAVIPDEAIDSDEALMKAATALVVARRRARHTAKEPR